jgi:hypothetical protein
MLKVMMRSDEYYLLSCWWVTHMSVARVTRKEEKLDEAFGSSGY